MSTRRSSANMPSVSGIIDQYAICKLAVQPNNLKKKYHVAESLSLDKVVVESHRSLIYRKVKQT